MDFYYIILVNSIKYSLKNKILSPPPPNPTDFSIKKGQHISIGLASDCNKTYLDIEHNAYKNTF